MTAVVTVQGDTVENVKLLPSREITVEITTYCGARCVMCPRHKYRFPCEHMEMGLFKSVVDQAVELDVLSLNTCGFGDVFMDPDLEEKFSYVKSKYPSVKIFVSSTGHLIHENNMHLLRYIDTLRISMYGTTKETYEMIHRGSLRFENVMANIDRVLALPKPRPYLMMNFLVLPENKHQIEDFKRFESRVDEVIIWLPHTFISSYEAGLGNKGNPRSCGRPIKGDFFVHANGEVSVCCFDYNRDLTIGDLRTERLDSVLRGEKLAKIRDVHAKGTFSGSDLLCTKCDQLYDRSDALLYATNRKRKIGVLTSHPDLVIDVLNGVEPAKV